MILSLIVAVADNGVIGQGNQLPWNLPQDLQRFKAITMGKPMVMGRKTWASIGRPLPGRRSVVITRQSSWQAPGAEVYSSLTDALAALSLEPEVMVIGGADVYRQALPLAHRVYCTQVHAQVTGDVYFAPLDMTQWREVAREDHAADARHAHACSFVVYERG